MSDALPVDDAPDPCGAVSTGRLGLRIGSIFAILVTSLAGTLFPILAKRVKALERTVPGFVFDFAKFFGSGVILATGFIHLLQPATEALGASYTLSAGGCISDAWADYPYAFALCLVSLYATFVSQMVFLRMGSERVGRALEANASSADPEKAHGPAVPAPSAVGRESTTTAATQGLADPLEDNPVVAQLMSAITLEFGVVLHSVIIGLTLSGTSDEGLGTLVIVIVFHQMFEGLGLGTRLALLDVSDTYAWLPWVGALVFSLCTPLGTAIGLGVREGVSMSNGTGSVAAGILDAISSGILLYMATVELIAHEIVLNPYYHTCSWTRLWFCLGSFAFGAGIMALLGKWT
ncbi:uncharacterized protein RHOBADRAFT_37873 [Rhodotorula graminis WP1]|uniref:ZIP zinc/iron transport family n=1 Tax=Rhodotorula graminis (strain WP1) TaxID=578459 RepID=A0A0N8Q033_RHOGW|nr:uncharacterized protein RHOBADRAFT_37873 [Rhodotorula graminis WP1]KPV74005.1 hypothetical protein RHOBADRAFT_37873 [Rhodotorula graminis WP1]